jgi:hypothetical protein
MRAAARSIAAIILGGVAASFLIMVLQIANTFLLFRFPEGVNPWDTESVTTYLKEHGIPTEALLGVLVSYVVASFVGGLVAGLIAGRAPFAHAAAIGMLLTVAGVMNLMAFPHPVWFWIASLAVYVPLALCGGALAARRSRRA